MSLLVMMSLATTLSMAVIAAMLRLGAGPLDQPNHRSLHTTPVPRGGGVGILAGALVGVLANGTWSATLAALGMLAAVSWWDDRTPLTVPMRLGCQLLAAVMALSGFPELGWFWAVAAVLGIVWITNLYNFMDGANGLAGGMAVFGFGAYAFAATISGDSALATLAACVAAAAAGFLVFNLDPARIFMGDVGSIPLGFLAATLGLDGYVNGFWPFWFPVLVFSPFVVDATVTLMRRALRREKVWQAHRDHCYQRLIRSGWSHRRLAMHEYALMAAAASSACLLLGQPVIWQTTVLLVWAAVYVLLLLFINFKTPCR